MPEGAATEERTTFEAKEVGVNSPHRKPTRAHHTMRENTRLVGNHPLPGQPNTASCTRDLNNEAKTQPRGQPSSPMSTQQDPTVLGAPALEQDASLTMTQS